MTSELIDAGVRSDGPSPYLLSTTAAELEHLTRQAEDWSPEGAWLLDTLGVGPGWRVVDIACGALGNLHLLAERVGAEGEVVGLDCEPRMLETARRVAAQRGLTVRFVQADAEATQLPRDWFHLAHTRTLLVNVPNPEAIVAEMAAIVRPGGVVALQEPDTVGWRRDPPHPAWDRLRAALEANFRAYGQDTFVGRRLPSLLRGAGLEDIQGRLHARLTRAGDYYQHFLPTLVRLSRERMMASGVIGHEELDELLGAVHVHLDQPTTMRSGAPIWQVWARRP